MYPRRCFGTDTSIYSSNPQFYLSVENSLCEDYVTEKFWKVLSYNTIPVLLNGANMTRHAPPNSYIDIRDFSSVKGRYSRFHTIDKLKYVMPFLK